MSKNRYKYCLAVSAGILLLLAVSNVAYAAEIHGMKWDDKDVDGIKDAGEPGVANVTIYISGPTFNFTTTNASGNYSFMSLTPGDYSVFESVPPGKMQTFPAFPNFSHFVNLTIGETEVGIDFGNANGTSEIHGMKWDDRDADGIKDAGEPGVANVSICYYSSPNFNCTPTNESGNYWFMNLTPGFYNVFEPFISNKVPTFPPFGSYFFNLNLSEIKTGIDFGNTNASEIHGTKFNDSNGNGVRDAGESGVTGVSIQLRRIFGHGNESFPFITFTGTNGSYSFMPLLPGFYKVEELLSGGTQTFPPSGAPHFINLTQGEVRENVDFGNQPAPPGNISGTKFNDSNGNGVQDAGESGVPGVTICLFPSGNCTTTGASGGYSFPNAPAGVNTVFEQFIPGSVFTTPPMVTVLVNSSETKIVNFGNRAPIPPSDDVSIAQQYGEQNGVPTVLRPGLTILTIRKNLTSITNVTSVNLTLRWGDGTTKTASMTQIDATGVWEANFSAPFPPGTAQMNFTIDRLPAGPGPEDAVQIGDIIFIDPSGTIKDACTGAPISGANATLLVEFPPTTGSFIVSPPANQIPPTNPLTTGADGVYSWLTVPGTYKVRAEKAGFTMAESSPVTVPPPAFNVNISITPTGGCAAAPPSGGEGKVKGEGWIVSPIPPVKKNNKATFDFDAKNMSIVSGKLEYNDHAAGLKVKGNVTTLSINKAEKTATFSGFATIKTATGTITGTYTVMAWDNSKKGKGNDRINITLSTGYTANATLGGGNIKVDP